MATPNINDLILYTNTPLTNTDYAFNWNKLISYLTDGTENFTIGNLTCKAITGVGNVGITGDLTISGTISGAGTIGNNMVATASVQDDAITVIKTTNNIVKTELSDDFSVTQVTTGAQNRTGAFVSITTTRASGSVLLHITSAWGLYGTGGISSANFDIVRDGGAEYKELGAFFVENHGYDYGFVSGTLLFTGLSAGSHLFQFQYRTATVLGGTATLYNRCSTDSASMILIAQEV